MRRSRRRLLLLAASLAVLVIVSCDALTGPERPAGPEGPTGEMGLPGLSALEVVTRDSTVAGSPSQPVIQVDCPSGKTVLGGGFNVHGALPQAAYAYQSYPSSEMSWAIAVHNSFVDPQTFTAYAVCAVVS